MCQRRERLRSARSRRILQLSWYCALITCCFPDLSILKLRHLFIVALWLHAGLDGSAYDNQFTVILPASAPTHAMTGEWCTQNGSYSLLSDTSLQAISSYKGPFCSKLDSVLCYRSRNSSLAIFAAEQDKADNLLAPGPAPSTASVVVGNIGNSVPSHNVTNSPQVVALAQNTSANSSTAQAG